MNRTLAVLCLVLGACATVHLAPAQPTVNTENPGLLSNGNPGDPTRQQPVAARPCVYACMEGYACDPNTGTCKPKPAEPVGARDAGPAWLP